MQLAIKGKNTISLDEASALKFPVGIPNQDVAENVVLRVLAKNGAKFLKFSNKDFKIINKNVENITLKRDYQHKDLNEIHASFDINQIINRLFKECYEINRDVFGMDGLIFELDPSEKGNLIAHRIQINLDVQILKLAMQIK